MSCNEIHLVVTKLFSTAKIIFHRFVISLKLDEIISSWVYTASIVGHLGHS